MATPFEADARLKLAQLEQKLLDALARIRTLESNYAALPKGQVPPPPPA